VPRLRRTGLGDITVTHEAVLDYDRAQRKWNEFWAAPERCEPLREHLDGDRDSGAPRDPEEFPIGSEDWIDAKHAWEAYWAQRSDALRQYLTEAAAIQSEPVPASSGATKLSTIRQKLNRIRALNRKWGCPAEPWASVSTNLLWNISNIPAAQISMIGKINGPAFAPIAACASFGVALKMALDAIHLGEAKAVVVGMTDPPPHQITLSAFYNANVVSADAEVSRPLTALKGTHIAGGACVWIVGDYEELTKQGFTPLGLEIVAVGTSSDATTSSRRRKVVRNSPWAKRWKTCTPPTSRRGTCMPRPRPATPRRSSTRWRCCIPTWSSPRARGRSATACRSAAAGS